MFFAPVVVNYLFGGISAVRPTIADVPDEKLQLKIKQVSHGSDTCIIIAQLSETCDASSFKELNASSEYDFRFSCGVNKPVCRLKYFDKENYRCNVSSLFRAG